MNILPKKSWHVLSRKNILKVREDESEARRIEEEKAKRAALAEQEARIGLMRKRSRVAEPRELAAERHPVASRDEGATRCDSPPRHINFFEDVKTGIGVSSGNVDHEAEKKAEQEKYEKKMGILTYLVDKDASESAPWYMKKRKADSKSIAHESKKSALDPLNEMQSYVKAKKKTLDAAEPRSGPVRQTEPSSESSREHHKKHSKHKKHSSGPNMAELRKERMRREEAERARTEALLRKYHGTEERVDSPEDMPGRYNSQFNPHLARRK